MPKSNLAKNILDEKMFYENVASNIRALCARRKITQSMLSKSIGMKYGTLNAKLNLRNTFTINDIYIIAKYFKVEPHFLLMRGGE